MSRKRQGKGRESRSLVTRLLSTYSTLYVIRALQERHPSRILLWARGIGSPSAEDFARLQLFGLVDLSLDRAGYSARERANFYWVKQIKALDPAIQELLQQLPAKRHGGESAWEFLTEEEQTEFTSLRPLPVTTSPIRPFLRDDKPPAWQQARKPGRERTGGLRGRRALNPPAEENS